MNDLAMGVIPTLSAVQFNAEKPLPFHIVKTIFSYIEQADCLECMMVSRTFFHAVPQYCGLNWETVNFTKSKVINERFWMCLGPHVRHITLKEDIGYIFDRLIKYNCCYIESIKFYRCLDLALTTAQTHQLIKGIHYISPQELNFYKINCDVPILEILAVSPKLKHFRCTYGRDRFEVLDRPNQWYTNYEDDIRSRIDSCTLSLITNNSNNINSIRNNVLTNVTNLCLDARMEKLMTVIKLCPNVQNLHICLQWPGLQDMPLEVVDLDQIFQVCSRLDQLQYYWPDKDESSSSVYHWKYIPSNNGNNNDIYTEDNSSSTTFNTNNNNNTSKAMGTLYRNNESNSQLKSLFSSVTYDNPPQEIIKVIRQHQQNLECIKIDNYNINFPLEERDVNNEDGVNWNQFANVDTKQLIEFATRDISWQNHALSSFLSSCSFLQYLSLYNVYANVFKYQPPPAQQQQQQQQQRNRPSDSRHDNTLLQAFSVLHHLRSFEFILNNKSLHRSTTRDLCTLLQVISDTTPNLEKLVVSGFHVLTDPLLTVVANNKNLRILRLGSGDTYRRKNRPTTDKGIHEFIRNLSPHIQFLDLTNLKLSSQTLFEELAERKELTQLVLNSCGAASPQGLRSFLTKKVNSLTYLRMDSCHIEHRKELTEYCKNTLHYAIRENRNQLFVNRQ
ncbi:hypothetical protein BDC45DRAFT_494954 [Circinella umbellata]|nr:hypothetical protein BDC45DRAFT_494954 [Circinella umbellata]